MADACLLLRRLMLGFCSEHRALKAIKSEGIIVVPEFLIDEAFQALQQESRKRFAELERQQPLLVCDEPGFHKPQEFHGGFDRFDGATLNRFIDIDADTSPLANAFIRSPALSALCRHSSSYRHRPSKFKLFQMIHGDSARVEDLQQNLHKDTFHSVIKIWYFLEDVTDEEGFMYSRGSHKMTLKRLLWEYQRSVKACLKGAKSKGGSFRVSTYELQSMGFSEPEAFAPKANTLVIADTRGFHCRGQAKPGAQRLAIYASLRPSPFVPFPY